MKSFLIGLLFVGSVCSYAAQNNDQSVFSIKEVVKKAVPLSLAPVPLGLAYVSLNNREFGRLVKILNPGFFLTATLPTISVAGVFAAAQGVFGGRRMDDVLTKNKNIAIRILSFFLGFGVQSGLTCIQALHLFSSSKSSKVKFLAYLLLNAWFYTPHAKKVIQKFFNINQQPSTRNNSHFNYDSTNPNFA